MSDIKTWDILIFIVSATIKIFGKIRNVRKMKQNKTKQKIRNVCRIKMHDNNKKNQKEEMS